MRKLVAEIPALVDENVELAGSVAVRRDHGKIIFIDIRDRSGIAQLVFVGSNKKVYELASTLRSEWVISVKGKVNKRPKAMVNAEIATGEHEVLVEELTILNKATTPQFDLSTDGKEVGEDTRMKYRYIDLRRARMQKNIRHRFKIIKAMRDYLTNKDFIEIETPILSKSTPEGARDYVVPSRLYGGKFFALPQSPQQYKQLLMSAGFERYFQVARCFRDEDTRGDRQPEFTQLDIEMSYVGEEDVINLVEEMLIMIVKTLYPEKRIQQIPFPRITYGDAMAKHGTDRPDIRENKNDPNLLAFCWVVDFPFFEKAKQKDASHAEASAEAWTFTHNPFSSPKPQYMEWLMNKEHIGEILTTQYDIVLNGFEVGGGSIRNHQSEALKKVFEIMGFTDERIMKNFGHMIEALGSGTPPHGGIAPGVDRLVMILENEPNIREVIAFPKTGDARDLMMDAPSEITKEQLKELHIEAKKHGK